MWPCVTYSEMHHETYILCESNMDMTKAVVKNLKLVTKLVFNYVHTVFKDAQKNSLAFPFFLVSPELSTGEKV